MFLVNEQSELITHQPNSIAIGAYQLGVQHWILLLLQRQTRIVGAHPQLLLQLLLVWLRLIRLWGVLLLLLLLGSVAGVRKLPWRQLRIAICANLECHLLLLLLLLGELLLELLLLRRQPGANIGIAERLISTYRRANGTCYTLSVAKLRRAANSPAFGCGLNGALR